MNLVQYTMSEADISDAIDNNLITGDVREYKELVQYESKEVESCLDELVVSSCDSTIDTKALFLFKPSQVVLQQNYVISVK